jgi:hypothetical protein
MELYWERREREMVKFTFYGGVNEIDSCIFTHRISLVAIGDLGNLGLSKKG